MTQTKSNTEKALHRAPGSARNERPHAGPRLWENAENVDQLGEERSADGLSEPPVGEIIGRIGDLLTKWDDEVTG